MTTGIGNVGNVTSGVVTPSVVAPVHHAAPAHAASSTSFASAVQAASGSASTATTPLQNTRIVQDPSAGYITEYLSANGSQIISQTPSAITVAYLRQGLEADGTPKHSLEQPVVTSA